MQQVYGVLAVLSETLVFIGGAALLVASAAKLL